MEGCELLGDEAYLSDSTEAGLGVTVEPWLWFGTLPPDPKRSEESKPQGSTVSANTTLD